MVKGIRLLIDTDCSAGFAAFVGKASPEDGLCI
jgi:hypothetical protein